MLDSPVNPEPRLLLPHSLPLDPNLNPHSLTPRMRERGGELEPAMATVETAGDVGGARVKPRNRNSAPYRNPKPERREPNQPRQRDSGQTAAAATRRQRRQW